MNKVFLSIILLLGIVNYSFGSEGSGSEVRGDYVTKTRTVGGETFTYGVCDGSPTENCETVWHYDTKLKRTIFIYRKKVSDGTENDQYFWVPGKYSNPSLFEPMIENGTAQPL